MMIIVPNFRLSCVEANIFEEDAEILIDGDLPSPCTLSAPNGFFTIRGNLGKDTTIEAKGKISITKSVGENSALLSHTDDVHIGGDVKQGCFLVTRDGSIHVSGVVSNSRLEATKSIVVELGHDALTQLEAPLITSGMQDEVLESGNAEQVLAAEMNNALAAQMHEVNQRAFTLAKLRTLYTIPDFIPPIQAALVNIYNVLSHPQHPAHKTLLSTLRAHQSNVLIEYCNSLIDNVKDCVIEQATGSGKTVLMAILSALIINNGQERTDNKVLLIVPKLILIDQTIDKFKQHAPHLKIARYVPGNLDPDTEVIVTTLQSLWLGEPGKGLERKERTRNGEWLPLKEHVTVVFLDEAHNFLGDMGIKKVVRIFLDRKVAVVALSATPIIDAKKPKKGTASINSCYQLLGFENPLQNPITPYPLVTAEAHGQLAPVASCIVTPVLDATTHKQLTRLIGTQYTGDISEEKLGRLINSEQNNRMIVDIFANGMNAVNQERFLGKMGITFAAGINHAEDLKSSFNQFIKVEGNTYLMERREQYVKTVHERELAEFLEKQRTMPGFDVNAATALFEKQFNAARVRSKFKVAETLHAGQYSVYLNAKEAEIAIRNRSVRYQNKIGVWFAHPLSPNELKKLSDKLSAHGKEDNYSFKVPVSRKITDVEEQEILQRCLDGGVMMLTGADKLIEGFDLSKIKLVIIASGDKSRSRFKQKVGRGLRIDPLNPRAMAVVVSINYGIRGQCFFPDIADDHWRLGNLDQCVRVDHSRVSTFDIPAKTPTTGIAWEPDATFRLQQAASATNKKGPTNRRLQDKELSLNKMIDDMIDDVGNIMTDLSVVISKLDKKLSHTTHVEKKAAAATAAPQPPKNRTSDNQTKGSVHFSSKSPLTDAFDLKLQKLMTKASDMNEHLERIIVEIEAITKEQNPNPAKRARKSSSTPEQASPERPAANLDQQATNLMAAISHLRGLQMKLTQIASGGINVQRDATQMTVTDTTPEGRLEADFTRIQQNLARLSQELNQTTRSFNVEQIAASIQAARDAKKATASQAPLPHKPVTQPVEAIELPPAPVPMHIPEQANRAPLAPFISNPHAALTLRGLHTIVESQAVSLKDAWELLYRSCLSDYPFRQINYLLAKWPASLLTYRDEVSGQTILHRLAPLKGKQYVILYLLCRFNKIKGDILCADTANHDFLHYAYPETASFLKPYLDQYKAIKDIIYAIAPEDFIKEKIGKKEPHQLFAILGKYSPQPTYVDHLVTSLRYLNTDLKLFLETFIILAGYGTDLNYYNEKSKFAPTVLHAAARQMILSKANPKEICNVYRWMIAMGCDPIRPSSVHRTPCGIMMDYSEFIKYLYADAHPFEHELDFYDCPEVTRIDSTQFKTMAKENDTCGKMMKQVNNNPRLLFMVDETGSTLLHHVITSYISRLANKTHSNNMELLLKKLVLTGADPTLKNHKGQTPLDYFGSYPYKEEVMRNYAAYKKDPVGSAISIFLPNNTAITLTETNVAPAPQRAAISLSTNHAALFAAVPSETRNQEKPLWDDFFSELDAAPGM